MLRKLRSSGVSFAVEPSRVLHDDCKTLICKATTVAGGGTIKGAKAGASSFCVGTAVRRQDRIPPPLGTPSASNIMGASGSFSYARNDSFIPKRSSSTTSDLEALQEVEDEEDDIEDEEDEDEDNWVSDEGNPYRDILAMAARASWRATHASPPQSLEEAQLRILEASAYPTRTKHTKPVLEKIILSQSSLRDLREGQRLKMFRRNPRRRARKEEEKEKPPNDKLLYYGPAEAVASLKHRLYPHFAMARRVLLETESLLPSFQPKRILDFGTGCGSAAAASQAVFGKTIEWFHLIDASYTMREVAETLLTDLVEYPDAKGNRKKEPLPRITSASHMSTDSEASFDLCIASFTFSELPTLNSVLSAAALMYQKLRPGGLLVVLEPGTPDGFTNIRMVRSMLLDCCPKDADDGAEIIAPCTHSGRCPMEREYWSPKPRLDPDSEKKKKDTPEEEQPDDPEAEGKRTGFCGFVQTMPGTGLRRGEKLSYLVVQKKALDTERDEDETDEWMKINLAEHIRRRLENPDLATHEELDKEILELHKKFINSDLDDLGLEILRNPESRKHFGRLINAPIKRKGHVLLDCCVNGSIERHKVTKSMNNKVPGYFVAGRKGRWGGFWPTSWSTKTDY